MTQLSTLSYLLDDKDGPSRFISGHAQTLGDDDRWLSQHVYLDDNDVLRCAPDFDIEENLDEVSVMLNDYDTMLRQTYHQKMRYYKGDHTSIRERMKYERFSEDHNRVVLNYAKSLVDTFNGFFIGVPPKVSYNPGKNKGIAETTIDEINELIAQTFSDSDSDEVFYELSKKADIYGRGYLVAYIANDDAKTLKFTYKAPENAFVVYSNNNDSKPMFGVTFDLVNGQYFGALYTDTKYFQFDNQDLSASGGFGASVKWRDKAFDNPLGMEPITEMASNDERLGLFDDLVSMMDGADKVMSQKLDSNDYFNNAILYTLGVEDFTPEQQREIKHWHVMQVKDSLDKKVDVKYLEKPDGDNLQENTLQHFNDEIYNGAHVVNLADHNLSPVTSGYALEQRMSPMLMMASTKGARMRKTIKRLLTIILKNTGKFGDDKNIADIIRDIDVKFVPNMVHNKLEESQVVTNLNGIVSRRYNLSNLSDLQDVNDELDAEDEDKKQAMKQFADAGNQPGSDPNQGEPNDPNKKPTEGEVNNDDNSKPNPTTGAGNQAGRP